MSRNILRDNASLADVCGPMIGLIVPLIKTNGRRVFYNFVRASRVPRRTQRGKQFVRLRLLNGPKGRAPNYNSAFVFVKAAAAAAVAATVIAATTALGVHAGDEFRVTRNQPVEG